HRVEVARLVPGDQGPDDQHRAPRRAADQDRRGLRRPRVAGRRHLSALRLQVPLRVSPAAHPEKGHTMDRRNFLKIAAMTGLAVAAPPLVAPRSARAALSPYKGPFYVMISARGGWDPTYLCDPKPNGGPFNRLYQHNPDADKAGPF